MFKKKQKSSSTPDPREVEDASRRAELLKADIASGTEYESRYYDVILGGIDRAQSGSKTIQTASAAIAALYSGALGLVFSLTGTTLPLRGVISPIFLALAVVLSTYYLAYTSPGRSFKNARPGSATWATNMFERIRDLNDIVSRTVLARSWANRAAVLALAVGLASMALPFVSTQTFIAANDANAGSSATVLQYPDPQSGFSADLEKIRYQAQIDAFVDAQSKPKTESGWVESSIFAAGWSLLGLAVVVVIPAIQGSRDRRRKRREDDEFRDYYEKLN